jgi:hypothetical protein
MPIVGNDIFQGRTCSLFLLQASQFVKMIEAFEKEEGEERKELKMKKLEKIIGGFVYEDKSCIQPRFETDTAMVNPRLITRKRRRICSTDEEEPPPPGCDVAEGR